MDERQRQRAVERLLEDVSITADLVDSAAKLLLEWGARQAEAILQEAADEPDELVGEQLAALRRMIKRFANLAGKVPPDLQAQQIEIILTVLAEVAPYAQ